MTFASISNSTNLFIDANILIYHATADLQFGSACKQLMARIARQEIQGFTSSHVLCDVAHRVMTTEAAIQLSWTGKGIAAHLRQNPSVVQKLTRFRQAIDEVPQIGIQVLPVDFQLVSAATILSQQTGLLTNDALILAVMRHHAITHLASNDPDFDSVPGITRYTPA